MNNAMMEIREIMMDANNVKSLKDGIALERKTNSRLVKSNAEMAIIILSKENNAMMVTIKILMDVQTVSSMMVGLVQMHLVKHRNVNCLVEMGNTNLSLDNNVMTEILTLEMGAVIVLLNPITNAPIMNLSESLNAKKFDLLVEMEF